MENIEFARFIERYLDNKMQSSERRWFEKEMEGNLWLRKELELRRKANQIASNFDAVQLRNKLQNAEKRHRETSVVERAVKKVPVNYAAVFLGLIVISTLLVLSGNRIDYSSITNKTVDNYKVLTIQRSGDIDVPDELAIGMELYNNGDFGEAIVQFESLFHDQNSTIQSNFLLGLAKMQIEEFREAVKSFDIVVDQNDNMFIEEAAYFMGLCYLNIDENERARAIMEGIIASESKYRKDAKKIVNSID